MAITKELLKQNSVTASLTEEQAEAVAQMSLNDENNVIATKIGEIYGGLDRDILETSGIAKGDAEKTYTYAKRAITSIRDEASKAKTQAEALTKEKARLEKALAEGEGGAELKKSLSQAQADLNSITKDFAELKAKYDGLQAEHSKEMFGLRMESEFDKALSGIKFKADYPEAVTRVIIEQAKDKIRKMSPEYVDNADGQGSKVLVFKNADGSIFRNPETNLAPYTVSELMRKELGDLGVLEGRRQEGSGSSDPKPKDTPAGFNARTQVEAEATIDALLREKGLNPSSVRYHEEKQKMWTENKVSSLPLR